MNEEYFDKAEKYLAHQLSDEERTAVETQRKENAEFEKVFQMVMLSRDVINQEVEDDLRLKIKSWREESTKKNNYFLYSVIGIAASLALIMTFYFLLTPTAPLNNVQLAKSNYTQPTTPGSTMGNADSLWAAGIEAYKSGKYRDAATTWEKIFDSSPEIKYYEAHAYFQAGEYEKASALFEALSSGTTIFAYPSDWYEILSLLAADQTEEMRFKLDKILSHKDHPYYPDASKLHQDVMEKE